MASFAITDEIFVMAASEKNKITPSYMYGLMTLPIIGWTLGTALGAFSGKLLPFEIRAALGLAIYAMFVAIIVPPARENRAVMYAVIIASLLSCIHYYIPFLKNNISGGFAVIICAVVSSSVMAKLRPIEEKPVEETQPQNTAKEDEINE